MKIPVFIFLFLMMISFSSSVIYAGTNDRNDCSESLQETEPYSVVITEIMADPFPKVLLPECEFVEIYNRNTAPVSLNGWKIRSGSRTGTLPDICLDPFSYALLCGSHDSLALSKYGLTIPVHGMPAIINREGSITLRDDKGRIIHNVSYFQGYYSNSIKADGGWSLEIVDAENPCGEHGNWLESQDSSGGTPGRKNSVAAINTDNDRPSLLYATPLEPNSVKLHFSEQLDSVSTVYAGNYYINNGMMYPAVAEPAGPSYKTLVLEFNKPFRNGIIYRIVLTGSISDCAGNMTGTNETADFALPEHAGIADLVISEVLFNASDACPEFIEMYNRSEKVINLSDLRINLLDPAGKEIKSTFSLINFPYLIFPGRFIVITKDHLSFIRNTMSAIPSNILETRPLFTLPDNEGTLEIVSGNTLIDSMTYNSKIFDFLLIDPEGKSLERTDLEHYPVENTFWYPASGISDYATPGTVNSQNALISEVTGIKVLQEVFYPGGNIDESYAEIYIECTNPGSRISLYVFNSEGQLVRTLARDLTAGTQGSVFWQGEDLNGDICKTGLYVIFAVISDISGRVNTFREAVTLIR